MKLLASKSNEKNFFLRSQLCARAYVRIWTLRPCHQKSLFCLISIMRDQVEQLKRPGFSAATKGIGKESDGNEEKLWMKELEEEKLGQRKAAVALDEVPL